MFVLKTLPGNVTLTIHTNAETFSKKNRDSLDLETDESKRSYS